MRENTLKSIWARGEAVVNGWLSIPSAFSAEVMTHQGFDSLTVDMQHGVVDYQVAVTMLQAISTTASDGRFLAANAAEEVAVARKSGVHAGTLPAY